MSESPGPLSRRGFIAGLGATAATLAVAPTLAGEVLPTAAHADAALDLNDIQGNILVGFNKLHAAYIGVKFPSAAAGRAWLAALAPQIASTAQVQGGGSATLFNVAFTYPGFKVLGVTASELATFPADFRAGMLARAAVLGDVGLSAPSRWPAALRQQSHALVIIAADSSAGRNAAITQQQQLAAQNGVTVLWVQKGDARAEKPGTEHFGYKDGISQPGIRGFTKVANPAKPNEGAPGQDLVWPGEFLIGHPRQAGAGKPITAKGATAAGGPAWAVNGSFLVFRRLRQDVAGWRAFTKKTAKALKMSDDLVGAKLFGRFKSGAPVAKVGNKLTDPGPKSPALLTTNNINNFKYAADPTGKLVPLASHIRKANPRDEAFHAGGLADTLTHRILRRGIPFGTSLPENAPSNSPLNNPAYPNDRGLFFVCYQSSIARQFEHMQSTWANNPNFPKKAAGQDPVTAQNALPGTFTVQGTVAHHVELLARFVITTGGDYYFQPSISALSTLSA